MEKKVYECWAAVDEFPYLRQAQLFEGDPYKHVSANGNYAVFTGPPFIYPVKACCVGLRKGQKRKIRLTIEEID